MIVCKAGYGFCFIVKAVQKIRVQSHVMPHHFNDHRHVQPLVFPFVDDTECSATDYVGGHIFTDRSIGRRPSAVQSVCYQLGDKIQKIRVFFSHFIELIFGQHPKVHVRFRFDVCPPGFSGQYSQASDDVPLAVMIHGVQFTILFNDDQARSTLNDIRHIFHRILYHKTLACLNMAVGHFVKDRATIFLDKELQEFCPPVRHPFFFLNHVIKIAILTGGPLVDKRPLCAPATERPGNRPADSARAFTGIDSVKGLVGGSRANTIFGGVFASLLPTAHHDFPTVGQVFLRTFFASISIHEFYLLQRFCSYLPGIENET